MLKACREAKIRTSWHEPNTGYEENIRGFVEGVFQTPEFIASLEAFIAPLVLPGPHQQPRADTHQDDRAGGAGFLSGDASCGT